MDALRMFWYLFWDPKVEKNVILGKSKMAATATTVPQRKKFIKQKKFSLNELHL